VRLQASWALNPEMPVWLLFGYFLDRHTDIMFTFQKGHP
jgi:hypothetical protein